MQAILDIVKNFYSTKIIISAVKDASNATIISDALNIAATNATAVAVSAAKKLPVE